MRASRAAKPGRKARPRIERLEARMLLTVAGADDSLDWLSSHGGLCNCPVCTGEGLDQIPTAETTTSGTSQAPLSSLPQLHSKAGATAKLFLDFDGHYEATWGAYSNANTPVYDQDGDATTFSEGELSSIYQIWAAVAEDFAPFNIDVTTVDPGSQANRIVAVIPIGGSWSDWFGSSAGGVAYVGGFYNSAPNIGYVFENNLGNGNAKYVAEAASHEAGHLFGLSHQATWSGSTLVESYNSGNAAWAPIMGVGYYSARTTWHNGPTSVAPTAYQDDMTILAGASNGFGYTADDYGSTLGAASALAVSGASVNFSGLIGLASDVDVWSFSTGGGTVTFQLAGTQYGTNLDAILELWDSSGNVIASDAPSASLGASLSLSLAAGNYYLVARSLGDYGNVGQYTITGSVPEPAPAPDISISVSGLTIGDGGTLNFGTTTPGTAVTRTITISNAGTELLTLSPLALAAMPAGFTLIEDLGSTSLAPGQTTTFVLRMDAQAVGSYSGLISLDNSDPDEGPFEINVSGTVANPTPVVRIVDNGNAGSTFVGSWRRTGGRGYSGDIHTTGRGNGARYARWSFTSLPQGEYKIWATWTTSRTNATNAPYTMIDGGVVRSTVRVNQRLAPSGLTSDGGRWRLLATVTVNSGQLSIKLTNGANGQVVADAIRIEQVLSTGTTLALRNGAQPVASSVLALASSVGGGGRTLLSATSAALPRQDGSEGPALAASVHRLAPSNSGSVQVAATSAAFGASDIEPEERLLSDVLGLLSEARAARNDSAAIDQIAGDELALGTLFEPLM